MRTRRRAGVSANWHTHRNTSKNSKKCALASRRSGTDVSQTVHRLWGLYITPIFPLLCIEVMALTGLGTDGS
eukprot:2341915-Pyramimonas_sp.AAC.1